MFSSPAIQIFSSENAENMVQRKPGSQLVSRKPFIDRSVNGDSSPFDRKLNLKNSSKKNTIIKQKISPKLAKQEILQNSDLDGEDSDLDVEDFIFSGREIEDTYNDVWPSLSLGKETMENIFRNYLNPQTPPPSPPKEMKPMLLEIDPDFFELPPPFICELQEEATLYDSSFEADVPTFGPFEDFESSF